VQGSLAQPRASEPYTQSIQKLDLNCFFGLELEKFFNQQQ
jgi:hypothetical protein